MFARKPLLDSVWVFSYTLDAFGLFVYARVAKLADSYLAAHRRVNDSVYTKTCFTWSVQAQ